jgi:hypothetical protein
MYVLQRTDGAYVTHPGSAHSYTRYLQEARTFPTREAAERERCPENERVLILEEAMGSGIKIRKSLDIGRCPSGPRRRR